MLKCQTMHGNCIWTVVSEWHGLKLHLLLLTKFSWNLATDVVQACVTPVSLFIFKHDVTNKTNIQSYLSSKIMASFHKLLCHHFLTSPDPMVDELLSFLHILFPSHNFYYVVCETSDNVSYLPSSKIAPFFS